MRDLLALLSIFKRNKLLMLVIALTFFSIIIVSATVAYAVFLSSPELLRRIQSVIEPARGYIAIPQPYTRDLYQFIFLNNVGHFWNPTRAFVWVPFVGAYNLGYELILNAVVIGSVASLTSATKGVVYTLAGLTPHGVIEIPAFILEFTGLARWHVTTTRTIYVRMSGGKIDQPLLVEGVKDTVALSLISVALFAVAAYVEAFVTPRLLGL